MNTDIIALTVPAKPEYVMITRLTSSAVASRIGFDVEQIEDIKMSVAEAQILMLNQDLNPVELSIDFNINPQGIDIEINGGADWIENRTASPDEDQAQLSKFILSSIMDEVEFKDDKGLIKTICMHKKCGGLMDL